MTDPTTLDWAAIAADRAEREWPMIEQAARQVVTVEAASYVLWRWTGGQAGVAPGKFHEALLDAIETADKDNQDRLIRAFPEFMAAWGLAKHHRGAGLDLLTEIANTPETPAGRESP